jgi:hypothetical protein
MIGLPLALIAFVAQQTLAFPGGGPSELCQLLSEKTALPVSCLVYDEKAVKPFVLKWQDSKDLDRLMWPVGKHHLVRNENGLGLYRGGLPSLIIASDDRYLAKLKQFSVPEGTGKGGRFTLQTPRGSALRVANLARMELSRPLSVHWLYQRLGVAVSAKNASEAQLLSSIAAAIGADFHQSPKEYRFDFDPRAYRTRFLESYSVPAPVGYPQFRWGERYSIAQSNLCFEAVRAITDAQLEKAFETNNGSVSFLVNPGTPLHRAVFRKVDAVEEMSQEKDKSFRQVADTYVILLNRIDVTRRPKVIFGPPAQVGAMFPSIDNPESWIVL